MSLTRPRWESNSLLELLSNCPCSFISDVSFTHAQLTQHWACWAESIERWASRFENKFFFRSQIINDSWTVRDYMSINEMRVPQTVVTLLPHSINSIFQTKNLAHLLTSTLLQGCSLVSVSGIAFAQPLQWASNVCVSLTQIASLLRSQVRAVRFFNSIQFVCVGL